jgi:hypothetical protein
MPEVVVENPVHGAVSALDGMLMREFDPIASALEKRGSTGQVNPGCHQPLVQDVEASPHGVGGSSPPVSQRFAMLAA